MSWQNILKIGDDWTREDLPDGPVTFYAVKDSIWNTVSHNVHPRATIEEIEEILGRKLTVRDFSNNEVNWAESKLTILRRDMPEQYDILMDRIGGEEGRKTLARQFLNLPLHKPEPRWSEGFINTQPEKLREGYRRLNRLNITLESGMSSRFDRREGGFSGEAKTLLRD